MTIDKSAQDWENSCLGCGVCCFEKIENDNGTIFYTQTACRYLDVVTRKCQIYENRFEINPDCIKLTPDLVKSLHWLPLDCGYVKNIAEVEVLTAQKKSRKARKKRR